MKILLVVPWRVKSQVLQVMAPMGLGYLARALKNRGHEVKVLDMIKDFSEPEALKPVLTEFNPQIVGFTVFTPDIPALKTLSAIVKQVSAGIITCAGGPHPSGDPAGVLTMIPTIDYVFKGEGEFSFPQFADLLQSNRLSPEEKKKIPGLVYRGDDGSFCQNPQIFVENLDDCGYTLWGEINPLDYQKYPPTLFVRKRPFAPIFLTRGCPFLCTYCSGFNVTGRRIRRRSIPHAMKEILELYHDYGIREFHIEDDNFTWNRGHVKAFCQAILDNQLKISWTMPNGVRLDSLDEPTLKMMKKAGCYMLVVGVESGSERVLKLMKKALSVKLIEEKIALAHRLGFFVHGFFMLGFPGETMDDMEATRQLALRTKLSGANFHIFQPLPGTEVADQLIHAGEICGYNYDPYKATYANVVYVPTGLQADAIKAMQKKMLLSFYLRPHIIFRYLKEVVLSGNILPFLRKAFAYLR